MSEKVVKKVVLDNLLGEHAYNGFDEAVIDFPARLINVKPTNVPYTFWHLLEHMRIAQRDILDYMRDKDHVSPKWPEEYWPTRDATKKDWDASIKEFRTDREELKKIVKNREMLKPFTKDHTVLREIILSMQHTAYHTGEFIMARQMLGYWKTKLPHLTRNQ